MTVTSRKQNRTQCEDIHSVDVTGAGYPDRLHGQSLSCATNCSKARKAGPQTTPNPRRHSSPLPTKQSKQHIGESGMKMVAENISGYAYGSPAIAKSPVTL